MEHALDLDTGAILRPTDITAYLAHPANHGRLVRVMGVAPFFPPVACTARDGEPAGEGVTPLTSPGGSSPTNDRRN